MPYKPTGRPPGRPPKPKPKLTPEQQARRDAKRLPGDAGDLVVDGSLPAAPPLGAVGTGLWVLVWTAGQAWLAPEADRPIVEMLCEAAEEADALRRSLESGEVPRFYKLANGSMASHPAVTQLRDLRTQQTSWLAALGFSPADRARLGLAEVRQRDALDELADELTRRRLARSTGPA